MPNTNRGNTTPTGPLVRTAHPNNKGMNMGSPFSSNLSSHRYSWKSPMTMKVVSNISTRVVIAARCISTQVTNRRVAMNAS